MNTKSAQTIAGAVVLLVLVSFLLCATADGTATYVGNWAELYVAAVQGKTDIVITADITYGEADETVVFTNAITLQSAEGEQFTLDGNGKPILCIQSEDKNTPLEGVSVVKNLIFQNGDARYAFVDVYKRGYGGALFVQGSLDIENCEFINNQARYGGALAVIGNLTIVGCTISENSAMATGGGIYAEGGDVTVSDSKIVENTAPIGGGIRVEDGDFIYSSGEIAKNSAAEVCGGGVYVSRGSVIMSGGRITENASPQGGGIFISDGEVEISGGIITENTAMLQGGGIYVREGTVTVADGCIFNNTPDDISQ